jgi:cytochrome c-type biogenesis protein
MGAGAALWGGFSAFFSIWQLCILQFSPFFLAFIVGVHLATPGQDTEPRALRSTLSACVAWVLSFTLLYSLLIASALNLSRPLINNLGSLRVLAGLLILVVSLYLLLVTRLPSLGKWHRPASVGGLAVGIGIAFALMYSPCITPMLSDIMGLASQRATALDGWYLAFFYGLGTSVAMCAFSLALIALLRQRGVVWRSARRITDACAVVLLALALMNISGLMTHYKAFLLGLAL